VKREKVTKIHTFSRREKGPSNGNTKSTKGFKEVTNNGPEKKENKVGQQEGQIMRKGSWLKKGKG